MNFFTPLPTWPFGNLQPQTFQLLVIDPPWFFEVYSEKGEAKSAHAQYECMSQAEIQALPVGELADLDCLAVLWATAPMLPIALETLRAWGFAYKTFLHWSKVFPSGKRAMGTGYRVRNMGEIALIATRGRPEHKPLLGNFDGIRRSHSRKPDELYSMLERCCPRLQRRADLFTRQSRPGWASFGNESTKYDEEATT